MQQTSSLETIGPCWYASSVLTDHVSFSGCAVQGGGVVGAE